MYAIQLKTDEITTFAATKELNHQKRKDKSSTHDNQLFTTCDEAWEYILEELLPALETKLRNSGYKKFDVSTTHSMKIASILVELDSSSFQFEKDVIKREMYYSFRVRVENDFKLPPQYEESLKLLGLI
jgi:hypothetical protein